MLNKSLFSSEKEDWETPQWLFDLCNDVFHFKLDAAASRENAKLPNYFSTLMDGLAWDWTSSNWCNPPYGRTVTGKFVRHAAEQAFDFDKSSVLLLPARTDVRWFHDYIYEKSATVKFIQGRLKFGNSESSAPFPSMLVAFGPEQHKLERVSIPWPR